MRLIIVDDHPVIRQGVGSTLANSGFDIVGQASSVGEGLAVLNTSKPEICLVDINLGSSSGIELITKGRIKNPDCKFVVLTMQDDSETLAQAQAAGASAYITKSAPIEYLIEVLHSVIKFDSQFIKVGDFQLPKVVKNFDLTQREIEVLSLLPSGKTASAIASLLFLSEATVKTHLASIYRKLGAANRAQAVSIGLAENLITK